MSIKGHVTHVDLRTPRVGPERPAAPATCDDGVATYGEVLRCAKRRGHDDPMAEVGGRRCDPSHAATSVVDGLILTTTWRRSP